ncbi:MAG: hypothetical protein ACP5H2_04305 [Solirubrobacteraceae bacterium]
MRALAGTAFPDEPLDRIDLLVVCRSSPCLGDLSANLTGGRVRSGTHRLDDSLEVGFVLQRLSSKEVWEVREQPGFFPPLIAVWEAALLEARRTGTVNRAVGAPVEVSTRYELDLDGDSPGEPAPASGSIVTNKGPRRFPEPSRQALLASQHGCKGLVLVLRVRGLASQVLED